MSTENHWIVRPRVRLWGQPLGLGLPLVLAGGFVGWNMLLAVNFREHWSMVLLTVLLALVFWGMFALGVSYLLTPFERVFISKEGVQLRLGSLVLRSIPAASIRSVTPINREIQLRRKDCDIYRLKINCNGPWPKNRALWLDWSLATVDALKNSLQDVIFLF